MKTLKRVKISRMVSGALVDRLEELVQKEGTGPNVVNAAGILESIQRYKHRDCCIDIDAHEAALVATLMAAEAVSIRTNEDVSSDGRWAANMMASLSRRLALRFGLEVRTDSDRNCAVFSVPIERVGNADAAVSDAAFRESVHTMYRFIISDSKFDRAVFTTAQENKSTLREAAAALAVEYVEIVDAAIARRRRPPENGRG